MFQTDIYFKNKDLNMHCRNKTYQDLNSSVHLYNSTTYRPSSPSPNKLLQPSSNFYQSVSMTNLKIKESFCSPELQKKRYVRNITEGNESFSHKESTFIEASNIYNTKQVFLGRQQTERSPFKAICSNFSAGRAKKIKNNWRTAEEEVAQIKKSNLQRQQPLFNKIIKKMNDKQKILKQIKKIAETQLPTRTKRPHKDTNNTKNLYSFRNKDINHSHLSSKNVATDTFKENSVLEKYVSSTFSGTTLLSKNPQEKEVLKKHSAYLTGKTKKSYDLQNSLRSTCSTTTFYQQYSTPRKVTKSIYVDKQQCFLKKNSFFSYDLKASQVTFQSRDCKQSEMVSMQELISKKQVNGSTSKKQVNVSISKKQVNGSAKLSDFIIVKNLGQGKFGTVSQVIHKKSGFIFAMKKISKATIKSHLMIQQLTLQIKIQSYCNHKSIGKIYAVFDDTENLYLLLEFMEDGTLFNHLKKHQRLQETQTGVKIKQVAEAVKYLHDQGIAHRDIKPENIVLTHGTSKLCDFGWATICNQRRRTYCGTFDYAAPQILQGSQYDMSVDMWCLGVLAYELLVGKAPFYHISRKQTMKKIMNVSSTNIEFPSNISKNAKDLIKKLLIKQPEQRLTAQAVLKHPFLTQVKSQ